MIYKYFLGLLKGSVRVKVSGKNPERLVNLLLNEGISIWNLRSKDGRVFLSMFLKDYFKIRAVARKAKCVARVVSRGGLPFFVGKAKKRRSFLLAAVVIILGFTYLSGSIWGIKLKGAYTVDEKIVLETLGVYGVRIGARKSVLKPGAIEAGLIRDIPHLSWAYVHFQGSLAVIELVEKVVDDTKAPGDITASKEGLVTSLLVLSGTPLVKAGQTVVAGELLIAGNPEKDQGGARGTVMAKTWYEVCMEIPLRQTFSARTGNTVKMVGLRLKDKEFAIFLKKEPFQWYEVEEYPGFQISLPYLGSVSTATYILHEIEWGEKKLTYEMAREIAQKQSDKSFSGELPSSAEVVDLTCEERICGDDLLCFRFIACVLEDIGIEKAWPKADFGG